MPIELCHHHVAARAQSVHRRSSSARVLGASQRHRTAARRHRRRLYDRDAATAPQSIDATADRHARQDAQVRSRTGGDLSSIDRSNDASHTADCAH